MRWYCWLWRKLRNLLHSCRTVIEYNYVWDWVPLIRHHRLTDSSEHKYWWREMWVCARENIHGEQKTPSFNQNAAISLNGYLKPSSQPLILGSTKGLLGVWPRLGEDESSQIKEEVDSPALGSISPRPSVTKTPSFYHIIASINWYSTWSHARWVRILRSGLNFRQIAPQENLHALP